MLPTLRDPRLHLGAVIVSLQVLGQVAFDFQLSIAQILVSILTCAVLEVGIVFWRQRMFLWPASALLTGNGVAFILRVPGTEHGDWWNFHGAWIFASAAAVSLLSKYLIRIGGRQVFNPSNFGLVLCFLILGSDRADPLDFWWAPMSTEMAVALALIVAGGVLILWRLRILEIAVIFWLTFAACIAVVAVSGHAMTARWHLGPIEGWDFWRTLLTSPEVLVFLFFMITDPKTIPSGRIQRRAFACAVAVLAALLIAPLQTEFASKVALLGALALVCVAVAVGRWVLAWDGSAHGPRELLRALGGWTPGHVSQRRRTVAVVCLATVAAGLLVGAGIPARPGPAAAGPPAMATDQFPSVTVVKSTGVATEIDKPTARRIAEDLLGDLAVTAEALRHRDVTRAAPGGTESWLSGLQARIQGASGIAIPVPSFRVERIRIALERNLTQAAPIIVAELAGMVERSFYAGSPPRIESRLTPVPLTATYELTLVNGVYVIARARSETPSLTAGVEGLPRDAAPARATITLDPLSGSAASVDQGTPFRFVATVRNAESAGTVADLELILEGPGPPAVFFKDKRLIPGDGTLEIETSVVTSRWFASTGLFSIKPYVDGKPAGQPLQFTVQPPSLRVPTFSDVTAGAGLTTQLPATECGGWVAGAAWADVDGDDDLDLFLPSRGGDANLWINDGRGRFIDEASERGVAQIGSGAAGASMPDYDNDGDPDLFTFGSGGNRLFRNDGTGVFSNVTGRSGLGTALGQEATSAAWGDFDRDGLIDLYVTYYGSCGPFGIRSFSYHPDRLYHNEGDGSFTDVTRLLENDSAQSDGGAHDGAGFQAAWLDYDGDGDPDLYVANDFIGETPDGNRLWRNDGEEANGDWAFTDVSVQTRTDLEINAMGIAIGDYDLDLDLDLVLSNIDTNKLLRNNGDGTFSDVGQSTGLVRPRTNLDQRPVTWGTGFADLDLDGWEDLFFAGGFYERPTPTPNELYVNRRDGTFADLSAPSGTDADLTSRGVAFADFDRDGRVDLYVVNQGASPQLFRNVTDTRDRHWLDVDLIGTLSNRDACGARIAARVGGRAMVRQVSCGSTSLGSWSDTVVNFGLGAATHVDELTVVWPSGLVEKLTGVQGDRLITITESRGTGSRQDGEPVDATQP